jgi:hypothetical protein
MEDDMWKSEVYWALRRAYDELHANRQDIRAAAQRTSPEVMEDIDDGLARLDECLTEAIVQINRLLRKI